MKKILFALLLLIITFEPSALGSLQILARDMGFRGEVEIATIKYNGGEYDNGKITFDPSFLSAYSALTINGYLAHEVTHYFYDRLTQSNDPKAIILFHELKQLPEGGFSAYADSNWKDCKDIIIMQGASCNFFGLTETLAEVAYMVELGESTKVPEQWLKIYYAIKVWNNGY